MTRVRSLALTFTALTIGSFVTVVASAAPAQAAAPVKETRQMATQAGIQAGLPWAVRHSGKCLDVLGFSTDNGANVGQWTCNGASNQFWSRVWINDTQFYFQAFHSGKCLDVIGYSSDNGARFGQWECNGAPNQIFEAFINAEGYRIFQVQHTDKCMDVVGFATHDGATVAQWTCNGVSNQQWW